MSGKYRQILVGIAIFLFILGALIWLIGRDEQVLLQSETDRIAFAMTDRKTNLGLGLYIMNSDGSGVVQLTSNIVDRKPSWAPDGAQIVYQSCSNENVPTSDKCLQLYKATVDNKTISGLIDSREDSFAPAWSPDGHRIAFVSTRDGNWEIYTVNAEGQDIVRLTFDAALDTMPAWSPDGQRIAYISNRNGHSEQLHVMNADGSHSAPFTSVQGRVSSPAWSPDGKKIAFVLEITTSNEQGGQICTVDAAGGAIACLTDDKGLKDSPSWSADSLHLAFSSNRSGKWEIYVMRSDGSGLVQLTNNSYDNTDPAWMNGPNLKRRNTNMWVPLTLLALGVINLVMGVVIFFRSRLAGHTGLYPELLDKWIVPCLLLLIGLVTLFLGLIKLLKQ